MISNDLPESAFAAPPPASPTGVDCCICDVKTGALCVSTGGKARVWHGARVDDWKRRSTAPCATDTTLVKSSRPATCAVCREVVTGSIELPTGEHVCGGCVCVALRNMIDDAKGRTDR